jgi:hypothetical protein
LHTFLAGFFSILYHVYVKTCIAGLGTSIYSTRTTQSISQNILLLNIQENRLAKFGVRACFFRSKPANPCLIVCHCGFQNWVSSLNRRRYERTISKRRFVTLPSTFRYPARKHFSVSQFFRDGVCRVPINNSDAADRFRIATRWFDEISSHELRSHRTVMCRHDHGHGC